MQKEVKQWITINGIHIPLFEGEAVKDAVSRMKNNKTAGPKNKDSKFSGDSKDYKAEQIAKNKAEADRLNKESSTQSVHKRAIQELSDKKYDNGTYDIQTKKAKEFPEGYQFTFCQIGDNYSDNDYQIKVDECLMRSSNKQTYAGKFGGTPEISFHCNSLEEAIKYGKENNQISIWDWKNCVEIRTGGTGINPKEFGMTKSQYDKTMKVIHILHEKEFNAILDLDVSADVKTTRLKNFVKHVAMISKIGK